MCGCWCKFRGDFPEVCENDCRKTIGSVTLRRRKTRCSRVQVFLQFHKGRQQATPHTPTEVFHEQKRADLFWEEKLPSDLVGKTKTSLERVTSLNEHFVVGNSYKKVFSCLLYLSFSITIIHQFDLRLRDKFFNFAFFVDKEGGGKRRMNGCDCTFSSFLLAQKDGRKRSL